LWKKSKLNYLLIQMSIILVTGPARSGKSEWAESIATSSKSVIYLATAQIDTSDLEWVERLEQHRHRRPQTWLTCEVPYLDLIDAIANAPAASCLLIDSLGTWVANLLEQEDSKWQATVQSLLLTLQQVQAQDVILVAEETGWGVVPAYTSGRIFRDRLGNLVRRISSISQAVYLVTGGYALNLTTLGTPLKSNQQK